MTLDSFNLKKTIAWTCAAVLQASLSSLVQAQVLEDIDLKREGNDAVVSIRFVTPVQFVNAGSAKFTDLIEVFYNVLPAAEPPLLIRSERRVAGKGGLPQMFVTDESAGLGQDSKRKFLIRLSKPIRFQVRAGREKQSIEIILQGLGAGVATTPINKPVPAPPVRNRYFIQLQSSPVAGQSLQGSVPAQFQDKEVFTAQRTVDTGTVYDINLGYFDNREQADVALQQLSTRFPSAVVSLFETTAPKAETPSQSTNANITANASETFTPIKAPTDIETTATALLTKALAAHDRGDYTDAIEPLNSLLNLPPNASSRQGQALAGQIQLKRGDTLRARGEMELFLKLYPEGADSDEIKQLLAGLSTVNDAPKARTAAEPTSTTSGSISLFYFGGQSQVRTLDFQNSPLSGLPVLQSESNLSATDQKQVQTNVDLNWRYRDTEKDMRFVVRNTYSADMMPNRPNINRLSALYFDQRSFVNGTSFRIGRQSPTGGGVLYRFDGIQAGYSFAPKWKVNAVYGQPTDALLDTRRNFYGLSVDAEALTNEISGSAYVIQQTIDGEVDRRALGTEMRYFSSGVSLSGQLDYDQVLNGLNIVAVQGNWQLPDTTVYNFLYDRRSAPMRTLGNILFFQDPALLAPARRISDLLGTTSIEVLRDQVNGITALQNQAMVGVTTPVSSNWQAGSNVNYTNIGAIQPVAVILPNGQASTGDLWSLGLQLIGSNLYSVRDTHVFNLSLLSGPTYNGKLLSYNNLSGVNEKLQVEPSLRYYTQTDNTDTTTVRWTPGVRMTYRVLQKMSMESELSYEIAERTGPMVAETSRRLFYYLGARYDF